MATPQSRDPAAVAFDLFEGRREFPLVALSAELGAFAQSTAERCNVPCCVPATGCLSTAARLIGHRARLKTGFGQTVGVNSFFVVGADPTGNSRLALTSALAPILRLQERLLGEDQDEFEVGRRSSEFMAQLLRTGARSTRSSPGSVLLLNDPQEREWLSLLETSDGSLLHYDLDGDMVRALLSDKSKQNGAFARFLKRAYFEELTLVPGNDHTRTARLQRRSLNLLWVALPDQVKRLAADRALLENGLSPCFIAFDPQAPASALDSSALKEAVGSSQWERQLENLWYLGGSAQAQTWQSSPEAQEILYRFMIFVHSQTCRLHPAYRPALSPWQERIWRIALLLHLLSDWHTPTISAETAWRAVHLSAWYLGRQFELLP